MAVRAFNGSSDLINTAAGALSTNAFGTHAAIVKRGALGAWQTFLALHSSGGTALNQFAFNDANNVVLWQGTTFVTSVGPAWATTSDWLLVVVRKVTGTATPRFSLYNFTTESWIHSAGGSSIPNWTAPGASGTVRVEWQGVDRMDGRLAARAAWNSLPWSADASGDTALEAAGLELSAANWLAESADALWLFNQAAVTADVEDVTGNGADQTSRTGTTVITDDDPPGFDFSLVAAADTALHVALDIAGTSVKHAQASATLGLTLGLTGTAATTPHADAELGLNLGIAATAVKRGMTDASLDLNLGIAATVGEPVPPSYLSVTVGPLRDPLLVDTMRDPMLVGAASGELVMVGELRDTAPTIGVLRDEQSPTIGELRDPLAVDEMREPVTIDELRE